MPMVSCGQPLGQCLSALRALACAGLLALLGACGGGGGGGNGSAQPDVPAAPVTPADTSPPPSASSPFRTIDLLHTQLVLDSTRSKLYAYVARDDAAHPDTLATIDPQTLAVSYSAPLGFVPFRLTVSPDGKYLYATTMDTREVVRMRLPDFAIDLRVDMRAFSNPRANAWDAKATEPYSVGVSPADSTVFAVSLVNREISTTCAERLRIYRDTAVLDELIPNVEQRAGTVIRFESADVLLTECTGTIPDIVSRVKFQDGVLRAGAFEFSRGVYGGGPQPQVEAQGDLVMTNGGSVFRRGTLELVGGLRPFTPMVEWEDFGFVLYGCTFADDTPTIAACLAESDKIGERYFALYSLTTALPLATVVLPDAFSYASQIIRVGPKDFAFALKPGSPVRLGEYTYVHRASRIYFISTQ